MSGLGLNGESEYRRNEASCGVRPALKARSFTKSNYILLFGDGDHDAYLDIRHREAQRELGGGDVTPRHVAADIMPSETRSGQALVAQFWV